MVAWKEREAAARGEVAAEAEAAAEAVVAATAAEACWAWEEEVARAQAKARVAVVVWEAMVEEKEEAVRLAVDGATAAAMAACRQRTWRIGTAHSACESSHGRSRTVETVK